MRECWRAAGRGVTVSAEVGVTSTENPDSIKPRLGQNIASYALPVDGDSALLISAFPVHSFCLYS